MLKISGSPVNSCIHHPPGLRKVYLLDLILLNCKIWAVNTLRRLLWDDAYQVLNLPRTRYTEHVGKCDMQNHHGENGRIMTSGQQRYWGRLIFPLEACTLDKFMLGHRWCWVSSCPREQQSPKARLNLKRWHVSSWVPHLLLLQCTPTPLPISILGVSILPFPQANALAPSLTLFSHSTSNPETSPTDPTFRTKPLSSTCFSPPPLLAWSGPPPCRLGYRSSSRRAASPCSPLPPSVYSQHSSRSAPQNAPGSTSPGVEAKVLSVSPKASASGSSLLPLFSPSLTLLRPHRAPCTASYLFIMFLVCLEYRPPEDRDFCSLCSLMYVQCL